MGEEVFEGLNDAQREAVDTVRGPVVILAGAGTGKTTTITRRIANQVATETFGTDQILAVTFTTKAAREMADRLARTGAPGVRTRTFHAESLAQFRRFSPTQPDILPSKGQILHGIVRRLPPPHRFVALRDFASEIEWAKNRRVGAREYLDRLGSHEPPVPPEMMRAVYVAYEERKRRAQMIDFEDLLERTVEMLESDPRALGAVRGRYAAFTVDEYQDVNTLQQALLDLWVGARDDLCVVGDDYQSIFGFTGASASHLLGFPERYPHAAVVRLTENHRSTPEVLSIANRLVPRLRGSRKTLRATKPEGPKPRLRSFDTGDQEVAWVTGEARRLHDEGVAWEQIAVLYRINARSEDFEEAFAREKIPFQVRDGSFLQRPAARAFLARARRARDGAGVAEQVEAIVAELGYAPGTAQGDGEEATRQADLERLVRLAAEFPGAEMTAFVADLRSRFASEEQGRGVQLMTYHRAKGLEFDAVFLPRLEEKELPFAMAESEEDLAEERRLLYVGITRAKRFLALSHAAARPGERRSRPRASRFLRELAPDRAPQPVPAARKPKPTPEERGPLFEALREWRLGIAREKGFPPYVVFSDATLAEIARTKPQTRPALRQITGVGPLKMQRYGEAVMSIVANDPEGGEAVTAAG